MKTYSESLTMIPAEFFTGCEKYSELDCEAQSLPHETVDSLYQHLDLQVLFENIVSRLRDTHQVTGLTFRAHELPIFCDRRAMLQRARMPCTLQFTVRHNNQKLGTLVLFREKSCSTQEVRSIGAMVETFSGPLSNALKYANACHSAYHDSLTGLFNRAALNAPWLSLPLGQSVAPLVLLVCDIDEFKEINDKHGHATGDKVLQEFSSRLRSMTRDNDVIYRYGGDEFVIALANTTECDAREYAERVRLAIEQHAILIDDQSIDITTTIGVTEWREIESFDSAFLRADRALLDGKKTGKNTVVRSR